MFIAKLRVGDGEANHAEEPVAKGSTFMRDCILEANGGRIGAWLRRFFLPVGKVSRFGVSSYLWGFQPC